MLSRHCRWVISGTPLHKYGNIAMLFSLNLDANEIATVAPMNYIHTFIFFRYHWKVITKSS